MPNCWCAAFLFERPMKKSSLWMLSGLAVAGLALLGWRLSAPRAPQPNNTQASAAQAVALELGPADVLTARTQSLPLGLPLSGTLKASETALLKARVAGELLDLGVREGDAVKAGQVLARIDPTEYQARWRQAQQQADAARAQLDIAQKQFENNEALVKQGFISQTALQTSLMSLNGARASHQSALAAADVARKALDDATLRAPISGQVAQRLAQPGERLAIDARVLEIVNLGAFELEAALPAQDAAGIVPGMPALLQVEGLDETIRAQVLRINPSTQAGSRSVLVYLAIRGREGLRHGAFAQGTLSRGTVEAIALPLEAVRTDKPQPYVQVIEQGRVRHLAVTPGARVQVDGQTLVVVSDLPEGTQVLAATVGAMREGVQVKPAPAAATR